MNRRAKVQFCMEFFADIACLLSANGFAYILFHIIFDKIPNFPFDEWVRFISVLLLSFAVTFVGFYNSINIHVRNRALEFWSVVKNASLTYMTFLVLIVLFKSPILESRYIIVSGYFLSIVFSLISKFFLKRWITNSYTKSKIAKIAGVITTSDIAQEFVENIKSDWSLRISGIALLDSDFAVSSDSDVQTEINGVIAVKEKIDEICDIPVIAYDGSYMDWIRSAPLDEVFINLPYEAMSEVYDIVEELEDMGITVHLNIPTLENLVDESKFDNISCRMYGKTPMATLAAADISNTGLVVKRIIDIIAGLVGSICSLPVIAITAIPLLIESPGPLIFKQERIGRNGRPFKIYKLRSMYADAEKRKAELMEQNKMDGLMFKMDDDPRITKVGKFIRKYSIDELPQFFNVLKGDMSLIGTRPPTKDEFVEYESRHKRRLTLRPGITGMWQVSGRSDIQDFEEVVKLDCEYIDNWSPMLDAKIFFKTIYVVLTHKGAE